MLQMLVSGKCKGETVLLKVVTFSFFVIGFFLQFVCQTHADSELITT